MANWPFKNDAVGSTITYDRDGRATILFSYIYLKLETSGLFIFLDYYY
jgi:hypothetical protein